MVRGSHKEPFTMIHITTHHKPSHTVVIIEGQLMIQGIACQIVQAKILSSGAHVCAL